MSNHLAQLLPHIFSTLISLVSLIIIGLVSFLVLKRKYVDKKQTKKLRSRITYLCFIVFIFCLIQIWLGGFSNLLTMLSLVGAGLVIVNKENIMNFSGWCIINWRSLFAEGDYVKILNYHGYVSEIRLFYFRVYETVEHGSKRTTGNLIKIPNSLVITNAISTFSGNHSVTMCRIPFAVKINSNTLSIATKAELIINRIIKEKYNFDDTYLHSNKVSQTHIHKLGISSFKPHIYINTFADKEGLVNIEALFYCYIDDRRKIEKQYTSELIKDFSSNMITNENDQ